MGRHPDKGEAVRFSLLTVISAAAIVFIAGCSHTRISAIVSVEGGVHQVVTRNRYKLVTGVSVDGIQTQMPLQQLRSQNDSLIKHQPDVFAEDGIPFTISSSKQMGQYLSGGNPFPTLISLGILPQCNGYGDGERTSFDVLRNPDARATFEVYRRQDHAFSLFSPLALLCYRGDPERPKGCENGSVTNLHSIGNSWINNYNYAYESAKAYAIAALLKKMEDDGRIGVSNSIDDERTTSQLSPDSDNFEIVDFNKDDGCEHRYSFTVKHRGGGNVTMRETRNLKQSVRAMVRADYMASFPNVDSRSLVVDFPEFALRDGMIVGKTAVLSLSVESLQYDANARVGTMRIRIEGKQFEDARRYARGNIESLVRDKNVVLDAKAIPDSATFYLRDETLKDDVLEITFKTE